MATFACTVEKITIKEHPNADAIELAVVGDYVSIVRKGTFKTGDLAVYIPEAAIVPKEVLEIIGLWDSENDKGMLAGKAGNRVKAIRLRGIVSQGIIFPLTFRTDVHDMDTHETTDDWILTHPRGEMEAGRKVVLHDDVSEILGIEKWEPPIPTSMSGEVFSAFGKTIHFDIENIKRFPDVLEECEEIYITEKLHGTWCCFGFHPEIDHPVVTSKGLSGRGLAFKFNDSNKKNLYMQMFDKYNDVGDDYTMFDGISQCAALDQDTPIYVLGEVFGHSVQDLQYTDDNGKYFRIFDIYVGEPSQGRYLSPAEVIKIAKVLDIDTVPVLYCGHYSKEIVEDLTNGKETVSGKEIHLREGIVIRPAKERRDDVIGRVILKSVSAAYLLRKGKTTEFN